MVGTTAEKSSGLDTPVQFVKGVGEARSAQLARLDIHTVGDLLLTLPRRYEDRRNFRKISELASGDWPTIRGTVSAAGMVRPRFGKTYFEALVQDESGMVQCRWYGVTYLQDQLKPGVNVLLFGKVVVRNRRPTLYHPELELMESPPAPGSAEGFAVASAAGDEDEPSLHLGRIVPIYPLTEDLSPRIMRRIVYEALQAYAGQAEEILPEEILERWKLVGIREALSLAHFPHALQEAEAARFRLKFEEFLCMQLVLVARKIQAERFLVGLSHQAPGILRKKFLDSLPFQLTPAQERALGEIRADMEKPRPMHRLLQGDVGSGKTVVAACALLDAIECGAQGAVMAPTEILAAQHVRTFARYLAPLGVTTAFLSGGQTESQREELLAGVAGGRIQLVVGTHALIQEGVEFKRLGLVVIDEQHKFGVEQRGLLYEKGEHPDVLVMTATPIPRTLAMTLYGDLDLSLIDEMPGGRQPIVTRLIQPSQLEKAYGFIRQQAAKGRQAYIVYPLVSESELVDLKAAEAMFARLKESHLAGLRVGLVHGQLPADEKDRVMQAFHSGALDVLVATAVVEVGVDVPNASVMLIENAERFGLAQLHQLRGRIGRGAHKSYCILEANPAGLEAWQRLKIMEKTTDGFRIAEEDFKIRGMGNLLGREQSGLPVCRVGNLLEDGKILDAARQEAFTLLEGDPKFQNPTYEGLRRRARALYKLTGSFVKVG